MFAYHVPFVAAVGGLFRVGEVAADRERVETVVGVKAVEVAFALFLVAVDVLVDVFGYADEVFLREGAVENFTVEVFVRKITVVRSMSPATE